MKINIKSEAYYNCPAPNITKQMFDWFYTTLWSLRLEYFVPCIETMDIKINQALPYMPVHFYITINGAYKFHKEWDGVNGLFMESSTRGKELFRVIDLCADRHYQKIQKQIIYI